MILDVVTRGIPEVLGLDPVADVQVLCPMKQRGQLSAAKLNERLQRALNPASTAMQPAVQTPRGVFRIGDKVMQLVNDHDQEIYNGEVGTVVFINLKRGTPEALHVRFTSGRVISYTHAELDEKLTLAYATTIHKAQGCEYPAVVIPMFMEHQSMLRRNLLYTAITRARQAVILVGQPAAMFYSIHNGGLDEVECRRWSKLRDWLDELGTGAPASGSIDGLGLPVGRGKTVPAPRVSTASKTVNVNRQHKSRLGAEL